MRWICVSMLMIGLAGCSGSDIRAQAFINSANDFSASAKEALKDMKTMLYADKAIRHAQTLKEKFMTLPDARHNLKLAKISTTIHEICTAFDELGDDVRKQEASDRSQFRFRDQKEWMSLVNHHIEYIHAAVDFVDTSLKEVGG